MSTYETSYASALELNSEDNTFTVLVVAESNTVATDANDDNLFETGEQIDIATDMNLSLTQASIVGIYGDGYVVQDEQGHYVLFSNTVYVEGERFALETEDPGNPGGGTPGLPVCFTKGTLIDTATGPVAIENLQAGDSVMCSNGLRQVRWIGWRSCRVNSPRISVEQRMNSAPVRIVQGALGNGLPSKDLLVSPWHHIYLDGVLVRANRLLNGITIKQDLAVPLVEYFHIELDAFDVVRAHGVYSESWADGGNRDFFENAPVTSISAQPAKRRRADRPGFSILDDKVAIEALNQRLRNIAVSVAPQQKIA